jgi:hypothetical protein
MDDDRWFEELARDSEFDSHGIERAPAYLTSRVYSAVVARLSATGPLRGLADTKAEGWGLCVFEEMLNALPRQAGVGSMNPCRVCHARLLGEHVEHAPLFWPHCPYSEFHRR